GGQSTNTGTNTTDGIDFTANWATPIEGWGSINLNWVATWVNQFKFQIGPTTADCAGLFGPICGNPIPEWRWKFRTTWNTPWYNTSVSLAWRYFSSVDLDASQSNPALASGFAPSDQHIGTQNYIDLAFGWNIDKNWTLYAGCNNVFDRDPPIISSAIAG